MKGGSHVANRLVAIRKTDSNNMIAIVQLNAFARASVVNQRCIAVPNNVHPDADENPTRMKMNAIIADE